MAVDLFADVDGDLATTADQAVIAAGQAVSIPSGSTDGAVAAEWNTAAAVSATYWLLARSTGSADAPARAPGRVTVNVPPRLTIAHPASDLVAARGGFAAIRYADDDPDDDAATQLFADVDGDVATTGDQQALTGVRPEQGGATQEVVSELAGMPEAAYFVVGIASDSVHAPVSTRGPGKLEVKNVAWAKRAGGSGTDRAVGIAALAAGSALVAGQMSGAATFGAGEPNETTLVSAGALDLFVARYAGDGTLAWAKRAGGTSDDTGLAVAAFPDGSCVVAGLFLGATIFGLGEPNQTILESRGAIDAFIARFAGDGSLVWASSAGGASNDIAVAIAALPDGACVATGLFGGAALFGAGEPNQTELVATGSFDVFVARYAADGSLAWAKRAGGTGGDEGLAIAARSDGSCAVAGEFSGTARFGVGEANETRLDAAGSADAFVARYAADGSLVWARHAGGPGLDRVLGLAVLADGSCAASGRFEDAATFGAGEANETRLAAAGAADAFVARYGADGSLAWAKRAGGTGADEGFGVAALADGSCVAAGEFSGTATFGAGEDNETRLVAAGSFDAFVARFARDGTLAWAKRAGGQEHDSAREVAADADGSCVLAGFVYGEATFGAGESRETVLVPAGDGDAFAARFNADGGF
jgi:hypothetical protein